MRLPRIPPEPQSPAQEEPSATAAFYARCDAKERDRGGKWENLEADRAIRLYQGDDFIRDPRLC